jgi:Tol biopolymer transport system component
MRKTDSAIFVGPLAFGLVSLIVVCARAPESNHVASIMRCEFGPGQSVGPLVNSPVFDGSPTVSADETELIFTSGRNGQQELFVSTRPSKQDAWSEPVNLGPLVNDSISDDFSPRLSNDGMALYFGSFDRRGDFGTGDMYVATRASRQHPWGQATNLGPRLNTEEFEAFPTPTADGNMLYFNRSTTFDSQDSDIYVTSRSGPDDEWSKPQRASSEINSERAEFSPAVTADGNTLYFASERSGTIEIWVSTRVHTAGAWDTPQKLGADVNVPRAMTLAPFLSSDQRSLYFMSARPDSAGATCTPRTCFDRLDLYVATVSCP